MKKPGLNQYNRSIIKGEINNEGLLNCWEVSEEEDGAVISDNNEGNMPYSNTEQDTRASDISDKTVVGEMVDDTNWLAPEIIDNKPQTTSIYQRLKNLDKKFANQNIPDNMDLSDVKKRESPTPDIIKETRQELQDVLHGEATALITREEASLVMKSIIDSQGAPPASPMQQRIIIEYLTLMNEPRVGGTKNASKRADTKKQDRLNSDEVLASNIPIQKLALLTTDQVAYYFPSELRRYAHYKNVNQLISSKELRINVSDQRFIQLKALWQTLTEVYDESGITKLQQFYNNVMDQAIQDPNSRSGQMIGVMLFDKDNIRDLSEYAQKSVVRDIEFDEFRIRKGLFKEQADFVFDTSRYKVICGARAIGKTDALGALIASQSLYPGDIIYINESSDKAISQMKDVVLKYCAMAEHNPVKVSIPIEWQSGARMFFFGGGNILSPDKLRGYNKARLIIFDESSLQPYLRDAFAVALPCLNFYKGQIIFSGNPPPVPGSLFEELWDKADKPATNEWEPRFKRYYWTRADNPYLNNPAGEDEAFKSIYGDGPRFKREMLGLMGAYDIEARVISSPKYINKQSNKFYRITIGVDYASTGKCAVIALGWNGKQAEVIHEFLGPMTTSQDLINEIINTWNYCKLQSPGVVQIKTDTDNQLITNELRLHHNLPAFTCSKMKVNKQWSLETLADCCNNGSILIPKQGKLDWEIERTIWTRDKESGAIIHEIDDKVGLHPDALMALEYAALDYFQDQGIIEPVDEEFKSVATLLNKPRQPNTSQKSTITNINGTIYSEMEVKI